MDDERGEARLVELESRQAFQEDTLASLNEALVSQQQRISHLEAMLALVVERLRAPELDLDFPAAEPPPPHY